MMNEKIKLLDHGYLRLVDSMGNDLTIIRNDAKRISTNYITCSHL